MTGLAVLETAGTPGSRRFRLAGEVTACGVGEVVAGMRLTELSCDVVLDVRDLTVGDRSPVVLFSRIAEDLSGRGRLYVVHPPGPLLRLVDDAGLEQQFPNLRVVRHPSRPAVRSPAQAWDFPGAGPAAPRASHRSSHRTPQLSRRRRG